MPIFSLAGNILKDNWGKLDKAAGGLLPGGGTPIQPQI